MFLLWTIVLILVFINHTRNDRLVKINMHQCGTVVYAGAICTK